MLGFVARKSQTQHSPFVDVIGTSADAIFGIIASGSQCLDFFRLDGHHLSHPHMTQRDTYRTEQVFGCNAVGIPFMDFIFRIAQFVFLSIRELESLVVQLCTELAFRLHTVNGLVVNHSSVIREEGSVLAGHINKHSREAITSRPSFCPQCRLRSPCIAMTASTRISGIYRTQSATRIVITRTDIIIQSVSRKKTALVSTAYPIRRRVVCLRRVHEKRRCTCRQCIPRWYLYVAYIQSLVLT